MAKSKISDQEFIAMWRSYPSPSEIARKLDVHIRNVFSRRNRIEARYKIKLVSNGEHLNLNNPTEALTMIISARKDINRLEIQNGTILIGSDAHYSPGHIPVAHKALCNVMAELGTEIKAVILNGDILDGGQISRHARIGWKKAPTVKQELEAVQERLGDIEKARPAGCKLMRTYGNHDMRFENRLSSQVPEFEGIGGFLLRDHLPFWEDSERIDINQDCVVIHDWHSGIHSGWNDVLKGGCHTVTGHTHELSVKTHTGFKSMHFGIKTGMLADESQDEFGYRAGRPGFNWQSGFVALTWVDGVLLYPEICSVRDGKAFFRGRLFAD